MRVKPTEIPEVLVVDAPRFGDERGFFMECYREEWATKLGVGHSFVQDNCSYSNRHVLRGLHYQIDVPQAKLVMVLKGRVLDVVVDLRRGSPTFGQHVSVVLSAESSKQLYVPVGFAHGFVVLSEGALVHYKCSAYYSPSGGRGLLWSDPALAIDWRVPSPQMNARDRCLPCLSAIPDSDLFDWPVGEPSGSA